VPYLPAAADPVDAGLPDGRITGEPGGGARVLYFKKERDE